MRVLFVTAEAYPLAKTGGLADVSRALPIALARSGIDIRLLLPGYPRAYTRLERPRIVAKLEPTLGITDATLIAGTFPGTDLPVWLIDSRTLFRRNGGLYQDENGRDWPDNALRFAFLAHVGAQLAMGRTKVAWKPDIVHANDWHTGLLPLILAHEKGPRPSCVFTSHNMAFQGNFPAEVLPSLNIPESCFTTNGMEFYGQVSFLKAGLSYADRVTTVSPTYAMEIVTPEFGCGMDGILRARGSNFSGILNGIDDALWDPATDPHLPQTYRAMDISGKRVCKAALQNELGLPASPDTPLIGFVSRLTQQKMADVILEALPWIAEQKAQLALVGEGDPSLEEAFTAAQVRYGENVAVNIGYDEPLAHRLQAGCDILLAPARFEPCGLTQLYALRYGSLPVVRRTGGLADTVVDATAETIANRTATGFVFEGADMPSLISATGRALAFYREPLTWRRLQLHAMAQDFSWNASAAKYALLYSEASGVP
ncbi:MAG TPA: glycogen synthase GlgA, partial [Rhizomicrobium sp.]